MGNLPAARVSSAVVQFLEVGIDYAGPFFCKDRQVRGEKRFKCYMCSFICLTVKAVHLELVTDLSTQALLQTFQRFIARRGRPRNIYSDNGTNLKGANKLGKEELNELGKFLQASESSIFSAARY